MKIGPLEITWHCRDVELFYTHTPWGYQIGNSFVKDGQRYIITHKKQSECLPYTIVFGHLIGGQNGTA